MTILRVIVVGLGVQGYKRRKFAGGDFVASVDPVNPEANFKSVKDVPLDRADPMRGIDWEAARDEVGVEITVLVEETGKLILQWARDDILV